VFRRKVALHAAIDLHMVTGGEALVREARRVVQAFRKGPHIFNLGHGITPDADPANVQLMIDTVRSA
jgi:uroporphyrinogen decarboxylase